MGGFGQLGNREEPQYLYRKELSPRGSNSIAMKSRMKREFHVRIRERVEVRFLRPTRYISEVLDRKPAAYFVSRIMREKRACAHCIEQGVVTAPTPVRIAPKSIFADETIVDFIVRKYCDALPLYRQRAILLRDLGIDVALTTINDVVLRVGELLIPIIDTMKRDLITGGYIQADET